MQLLLTDRLTCPRCGPSFGLILLADELVDRKVRTGKLGCPNCRDAFEIRSGFADLRAPPRGELPSGRAGEDPRDAAPDPDADRLLALLGVSEGPATLALVGGPARHARHLTGSLRDVHVVAIDPDTRTWADEPSVSRLIAGPGLPFFDRVLRGVGVDGRLADGVIREAARVLAPQSRVVVLNARSDASAILREAGLSVLAEEGETVVATRG